VQAALKAGTLDPERLARWRKLSDENRGNTPVQSGPRGGKSPAGRGKRR
jgi:ribosome biogenesis GTPase